MSSPPVLTADDLLVDPKAKRVTVYRGPRDVVVLDPADTLDGGEVVPGFVVAVGALFPSPAP
jgi:hypothetical protein